MITEREELLNVSSAKVTTSNACWNLAYCHACLVLHMIALHSA